MDVPARIILARAAHRRRTRDRAEADIEARIEFHAAEVHEAPRLHADIGKPHGFPEAHGDPGPQTAQAHRQVGVVGIGPARRPDVQPADGDRSEEHTSELQSLMRNSYAVFCLKKKKNNNKYVTETVKSKTPKNQ